MSLSQRELDDLEPMIEKAVRKFLGFDEQTLVIAAVNCLDKGYDEDKTERKLGSILDSKQASKFSKKLFDLYDDYRASSKHERSRKRKDDRQREEEESEAKRTKKFQEAQPAPIVPPDPNNPSPGQLTADKIKEMMQNAQKMIQMRKAQLNLPPAPAAPPPEPPKPKSSLELMLQARDKAKRASELQNDIQARLAKAGLGAGAAIPPPPSGVTQGAVAADGSIEEKPTPLILDEQGRTIDINTGETIQLKHYMPTLKANIRAKKREEFKQQLAEKPPEDIQETRFFDQRVALKPAQRMRRAFKFHEKGKFEQLASKLRTKAQLEKLQNEIAQAAKKTGIASAAKLATIQPKKELVAGEIPNVEWWDGLILRNDDYDTSHADYSKEKDKYEGITHLVEHPAQMKPPDHTTKKVVIPVMLTAKERKKLRRQNRSEGQKEITEKIRLGLLPPPEPKVRLANLMRVLGTEAVMDPSKVEAHVRAQMAKRVHDHEERNEQRKLTKEQRRDKKIKKIKEDTSCGVHVSVYRVRDLKNPARKFKVETNANQLFMTGIVVLHKECNVVVVEGGPKQQKKFRRLMMHRISWSDESKAANDDDDDSGEEDDSKTNRCNLVWEGTVKNRAFGELKFKLCPTETFAREQFKKNGVEHYWDLAFSGAILEMSEVDS